ncbi:hypothetical protein RQP46_004671 [Phenoliferia psychrophenolica]
MDSSPAPLSPTSPTAASAGPAGGPGGEVDLWESILSSTAGSRSVVTKNAIILGSHKSGKSTLIHRLASPTGEAAGGDDEQPTSATHLDLGLSYSFLDVGDEADEETVARLGVYQLPSPHAPYPSLLPLALSRATLLDSLVIIVLDWERPWRFLKELRAWIGVLEGVLKGKGVAEGWEGQEGRERLEAHFRHYFEPTATAATAGPSASQLADTEAPLPPGVLTDNLGISLVIVCTKADQIMTLERDKDFKEEQFDYVQQTLRTIALKYGAALFMTSHSRPASFAKLRSYLLHRLFAQPSPSLTSTAPSASAAPVPPTLALAPVATARAFPFLTRANAVDRDQILVPTGWDSWGKIRILRDRYDTDAVSKGWDLDMDNERDRLASAGGARGGEEDRVDEEGRRVISALRMYEEVVVDLDGDDQPINMAKSLVQAQDEQDFLKGHHETLQKEREKDPRSAFAARPGSISNSNNAHADSSSSAQNGLGLLDGAGAYGASVVGPMASTGLSLPSVERALERDPEDVTARMVKNARRDSTQSASRSPPLSSSAFSSAPLGSSTTAQNGASSTPALLPPGAAGAPGAPGTASNEVLHNFFQSLLAKRTATGAAQPNGVTNLTPASSPSPPSAMDSRAPSGNGVL